MTLHLRHSTPRVKPMYLRSGRDGGGAFAIVVQWRSSTRYPPSVTSTERIISQRGRNRWLQSAAQENERTSPSWHGSDLEVDNGSHLNNLRRWQVGIIGHGLFKAEQMSIPVETNRENDNTAVILQPEVVTSAAARMALGVLRICFGFTFLWAFLDKLLALGYSTGKNPETGAVDRFGDAAWINGGSPTEGFLTFGVPEDNPFKDTFNSMAGQTWADWLFMLGLLGIGIALLLGFAVRLAGLAGAILYLLMWLAVLPLENNPVVDDHLTGAVVVIVLALTLAGDTLGVGKMWARIPLVRKTAILR